MFSILHESDSRAGVSVAMVNASGFQEASQLNWKNVYLNIELIEPADKIMLPASMFFAAFQRLADTSYVT